MNNIKYHMLNQIFIKLITLMIEIFNNINQLLKP